MTPARLALIAAGTILLGRTALLYLAVRFIERRTFNHWAWLLPLALLALAAVL